MKIVYKISDHYKKINTKKGSYWSVAVVLTTFVWAGFNSIYASEHIYTNRDPAVYGQTAVWLAKTGSLHIPKDDIVPNVAGLVQQSGGFDDGVGTTGNRLYAQGTHTVPGLLAVFASYGGGLELVYRLAPFISSFALMAFFSFARLYVRDGLAASATGLLAICLPMLYFSRDIYTEPLLMSLIFFASTIILYASKSVGGQYIQWLLGGIALGAAVLARIDALLPIASLLLVVTVSFVTQNSREGMKKRLRGIFMFVVGLSATSTLAFLELYHNSNIYFFAQSSSILKELALVCVVVVISAIVMILAYYTSTLYKINETTRRYRGVILASLSAVVIFVLALRPLYMVDRVGGERWRPSVKSLIEKLQLEEGSTVDVYRTYAEHTMSWVTWYLGPIIVGLAVIAFVAVVYRSLYSKEIKWIILVALIGSSSVYFIIPAITPDQIWAIRRFLPIVIPCTILLAMICVSRVAQSKFALTRLRTWAILSGALIALYAWPVYISAPFVFTKEYDGQLTQFEKMCETLPSDGVVIWVGRGHIVAPQTTRGVCDLPSAGLRANVSPESTREIVRTIYQKRGVPYVASFNLEDIPKWIADDSTVRLVSETSYKLYEQELMRPPRHVNDQKTSIYIGKINL